MKSDIKDRWVAALRSGKYKQGTIALTRISNNNEKTYCCLGVLCDILKNECDSFQYNGIAPILNIVIYGTATASLSRDQSAYVELSFFDQKTLIRMNDSDRKSFNEIADYIEENL